MTIHPDQSRLAGLSRFLDGTHPPLDERRGSNRLRFGAKLFSPPAIDRELGTIDLLTWTDTQETGGRQMIPLTRCLPKRG